MNVLIIEDDPMVDFIHRNYLEKLNLFDRNYIQRLYESCSKHTY